MMNPVVGISVALMRDFIKGHRQGFTMNQALTRGMTDGI